MLFIHCNLAPFKMAPFNMILYFVYGVRKTFQRSLYVALVVAVAGNLLEEGKGSLVSRPVHYGERLLVGVQISVMLFLVKTMVMKVVAFTFHDSSYFNSAESKSTFSTSAYVMETLSNPPLIDLQRTVEEDAVQQIQTREEEQIQQLRKVHEKMIISAWTERLMRQLTLDKKIPWETGKDKSTIRFEYDATMTAKEIFSMGDREGQVSGQISGEI